MFDLIEKYDKTSHVVASPPNVLVAPIVIVFFSAMVLIILLILLINTNLEAYQKRRLHIGDERYFRDISYFVGIL